jgi:hypothetical protein
LINLEGFGIGGSGLRKLGWIWLSLWIISVPAMLAEVRFLGLGQDRLPFTTYEQVVDFLRTATVLSIAPVGAGVTGASKVVLDRNGVRAHAIFRDVCIETTHTLPTGTEIPFRDDCIFECAAYELSCLLDLNLVPPTVVRSIGERQGTLQIWIEGAVSDSNRKQLRGPGVTEEKLEKKWAVMAIFDNLIYNDDRNRNNYLYGEKGRIWLIDHTRAFLTSRELPYPAAITQIDPKLLQKLKSLDSEEITERMRPFLRTAQIEALLARRDLLVEYLEDFERED